MALALLTALAAAQQSRVYREGGNWVQESTGSLAAARNLRVQVDVGSVRVEGGAGSISYVFRNRVNEASEEKARRILDSYKVSTYVRGDTAWVVGEWQGGRAHRFSGEFVINVPRELDSVEIETQGGNVTASNLGGRVDAQSGGGVIKVTGVGNSVRAETLGGVIEASDIGGEASLHTGGGGIKVAGVKRKITAESGGGSISVTGCTQGASLETGGGNIAVDRCYGPLSASTGGGSIDIGDISGPATIETAGGSIRVSSAKNLVKVDTGSGAIELNGISAARAQTGGGAILAKFVAFNPERNDSLLETAAGDITVFLAPNLNLTVQASIEVANGHNIRSEFPEFRVVSEGGQWGPKAISAEGNLNGGGPVLKVRTTSGDIVIRRASQ
ncbi:MAG: DUF4097 family beta strand repeat protein [Acidobacteria bacterium]|nr:DUF4097 family beta strand repeat protein [Acidobacteriota bacterium]